jgi:hypothetical protein
MKKYSRIGGRRRQLRQPDGKANKVKSAFYMSGAVEFSGFVLVFFRLAACGSPTFKLDRNRLLDDENGELTHL